MYFGAVFSMVLEYFKNIWNNFTTMESLYIGLHNNGMISQQLAEL